MTDHSATRPCFYLIFGWLFIVTWNEYELKPNFDGLPYHEHAPGTSTYHPLGRIHYYTIEVTTKTIKLATQKDLDLFVGYSRSDGTGLYAKWISQEGIISSNAFNIQINEVAE